MSRLSLLLVPCTALLLSACDNSPPANPAPPAAESAEPAAEPAPAEATPTPTLRAPLPTAGSEGELTDELEAPIPQSSRPLSRQEAAAMEPLFGVWAVDLASCDTEAISISATRFEGAESGCDITSLVDTGNWNFLATLSCGSGNQAARERISMVPLFAPTGEGIGLTYLDREGQPQVTVLRCE